MTDRVEPTSTPVNGAGSDAVADVPHSVLEALGQEIEAGGGEWQEPPEYEGSVGRTMFDSPSSEDGSLTVLLPRDNIDKFCTQAIVRIRSVPDGRSYLGAVVQGPFADPDGLRADAPIIVTTTVRGALLLPRYHGRVQVALLGEELDDGAVVPPRRRPRPNSPVFLLAPDRTAEVLGLQGDIRLGLAESDEEIEVRVPSDSKAVFPRHLGILGTTGGGKSTTVSGLTAQLQASGAAIIMIDTEGEYTALCDPTDSSGMLRALERRGLAPAGVPDTTIFHLVGRETRNPRHPSRREFTLRFSKLSPYAVMEVLDLTEPQQERYLKAYDIGKQALRELEIFPQGTAHPQRARQEEMLLDLDEFETGYPQMTLAHMYDVVRMIANSVGNEPWQEPDTPAFRGQESRFGRLITTANVPKSISSWRALQGKLGRLRRLRVFDSSQAQGLPFRDMAAPGAVSIIDLSDTDSPDVRNLTIAELLRSVQEYQDVAVKKAEAAGERPTPIYVFIEEAHEFLSAERIKQMPILFGQVARIARRGRKRWLGLVFSTQLPQHLPNEVLGLINNWILHKINDVNVIDRLRRSVGGIDDALWRRLPSLAPGQAIVSFTSMNRPLLVAIDPAPARLLMVE